MRRRSRLLAAACDSRFLPVGLAPGAPRIRFAFCRCYHTGTTTDRGQIETSPPLQNLRRRRDRVRSVDSAAHTQRWADRAPPLVHVSPASTAHRSSVSPRAGWDRPRRSPPAARAGLGRQSSPCRRTRRDDAQSHDLHRRGPSPSPSASERGVRRAARLAPVRSTRSRAAAVGLMCTVECSGASSLRSRPTLVSSPARRRRCASASASRGRGGPAAPAAGAGCASTARLIALRAHVSCAFAPPTARGSLRVGRRSRSSRRGSFPPRTSRAWDDHGDVGRPIEPCTSFFVSLCARREARSARL